METRTFFNQKMLCIFYAVLLAFVLILGMTEPASFGPAAMAAEVAKLVRPRDASPMLQYTAKGHVLGFTSGKAYLAGLDHALTVEFVDGQSVEPVGISDAQTASKFGSNLPLRRVTYPEMWPGIDVVYTPLPSGLVESTYVIKSGAKLGDIRLKYNAPIKLAKDGSLTFTFETGICLKARRSPFKKLRGNEFQ